MTNYIEIYGFRHSIEKDSFISPIFDVFPI